MYVKCGHCPACLQEKAANRVRRIKNTFDDSLACYMVTLTYSRGTAPYVLRDEAFDFVNGRMSELNVYRDCMFRKVRKPSDYNDYNQVNKKIHGTFVLDSVSFDYSGHANGRVCSLKGTKDLKHEFGKIGVVHYPDYQHFISRLRLNLKRHYNYEGKLFVYACSEFGSSSFRPHFHLLLFIIKSAESALRSSVFASWPFSNLARFPRAFERCFNAASYVASYVNQPANFPVFFKTYFPPKHSYSKGFGLGRSAFSLSNILQKVEQGHLWYSVIKDKQGQNVVSNVPFPAYVINRYFPKFKTYTRIAPCSLVENMQRIGQFKYGEFCDSVAPLYLSEDEFYKVNVRLHNAYKRYVSEVPAGYSKNFIDYYMMHKRVWDCYNSSILRLHLENNDIPILEKYDNLDVVLNNKILCEGIPLEDISTTDPNEFRSTRYNTYCFEQSFYDNIKHKNVSNEIYALQGDCEL